MFLTIIFICITYILNTAKDNHGSIILRLKFIQKYLWRPGRKRAFLPPTLDNRVVEDVKDCWLICSAIYVCQAPHEALSWCYVLSTRQMAKLVLLDILIKVVLLTELIILIRKFYSGHANTKTKQWPFLHVRTYVFHLLYPVSHG